MAGRVDDRARFIHDTLEQLGWDVLIADAQRVKRLAPVACKTDRVDSRVLAVLSHRDLGDSPAVRRDAPPKSRRRGAAVGTRPTGAAERPPRWLARRLRGVRG